MTLNDHRKYCSHVSISKNNTCEVENYVPLRTFTYNNTESINTYRLLDSIIALPLATVTTVTSVTSVTVSDDRSFARLCSWREFESTETLQT